MDSPLFPVFPENLGEQTEDELADLLKNYEVAAKMIEDEDPEYTKGLSAEDLISTLNDGVEAIEKIVAEQKRRVDEVEEFQRQKDELAERRRAALAAEGEGDGEGDGDGDGDGEGDGEGAAEAADDPADDAAAAALAAEAEGEGDGEGDGDGDGDGEGDGEGEGVVEPAAVLTASASTERPVLRRPPAPSRDRRAPEVGTVLVAAAGTPSIRGGQILDRLSLAESIKKLAQAVGRPTKSESGIEQRFLVASAEYKFPAERILSPGEADANAEKIRKVVPDGIPGVFGNRALVASGGLCAPLEPIYTMPNFASQARPVRDALPSFQADRGGVNVPTATYIGDIVIGGAAGAISVIDESEDALGGTFATKSCQDLDCPDYTEVAVTIIAHCREYGNLNARAWPEKIAHENDLTMAAHARTAESFLLSRIKAESLKVTQGTVGTQMNAFGSLAHAINKMAASIRFNLRMDPDFRFRVLMPSWIGDLLAADDALKQLDTADRARGALTAKLANYGVSVSYYWDNVYITSDGSTSQGFAAEVDGTAADDFPDDVQYALFPEGAFIHVDSGTLELGLVRDSTLNTTNDFQIFGESFENVARLAPLQATRWITQDICPSGQYPALGTALAC